MTASRCDDLEGVRTPRNHDGALRRAVGRLDVDLHHHPELVRPKREGVSVAEVGDVSTVVAPSERHRGRLDLVLAGLEIDASADVQKHLRPRHDYTIPDECGRYVAASGPEQWFGPGVLDRD